MLTNVEELENIYGKPNERSVRKEISYISEDYAAFILASPFVMLASAGEDGLDCSPKGDATGFVRILDPHTLAIPDRPGNNRIDTLRNLVHDPRIALLFLVPGAGEMMRVNGRASIADDSDLLASFSVNGKPPRTVILVHVESVYFHCSKAVVRSDLWNADKHVDRASLPSAGAMLKNVSDSGFDADAYDRALPGRLKTDLY
ncbi:pyridoxamine 5'-phosphate oxidase [Burkholderia sp. Leaf177]|uniref:pyridoxamine 5'-phosphate oxidase family protein n=1 Tax=Burkholderia sp. Leaf177 TaxID=1736287 RepID=UPI00070088A7|nr:pyridoxamine 5'-phosphate oxidase family protein [Burkholderia sp. Leaf177]KQR78875.1 pyridoxamine 5'-phosphate oxidase [Burkholderia sp. Leaf177]